MGKRSRVPTGTTPANPPKIKAGPMGKFIPADAPRRERATVAEWARRAVIMAPKGRNCSVATHFSGQMGRAATAFQSKKRKCPRRESNPHHRFRKPVFYPLNYGDERANLYAEGVAASRPHPQRRTGFPLSSCGVNRVMWVGLLLGSSFWEEQRTETGDWQGVPRFLQRKITRGRLSARRA